MIDEHDLRVLAGRLLAGGGELEDEHELAADDELACELTSRLATCGVTLVRGAAQAPLCVIADTGEELQELALACLALCALTLGGERRARRARLTVREISERVGSRHGYTEVYVRRTGLGPLEARGLINVTKPSQRASEAYVTAGPALAAVDRDLIQARLRAYQAAS